MTWYRRPGHRVGWATALGFFDCVVSSRVEKKKKATVATSVAPATRPPGRTPQKGRGHPQTPKTGIREHPEAIFGVRSEFICCVSFCIRADFRGSQGMEHERNAEWEAPALDHQWSQTTVSTVLRRSFRKVQPCPTRVARSSEQRCRRRGFTRQPDNS